MRSYYLPPNMPLDLTPLRVEQDRPDFDSWFRLDCFPDLSVRRSSAADRWAALCDITPHDTIRILPTFVQLLS
jgi:hypothetical protein